MQKKKHKVRFQLVFFLSLNADGHECKKKKNKKNLLKSSFLEKIL